ncbi:MAG: replication factor C small subunit [Methanosarcinales archaeon]
MIWIQKYRPTKFDELVDLENIKKELGNSKMENCPHLLFFGNSGTGKTTVAEILARKFLGKNYKSNFKELNASDERGIGIVREDIKLFCKSQPTGTSRRMIFLDEADHLTDEAQHALRRIMEKYQKNCLFILSCNYLSKIISAIQSRCAVYSFPNITQKGIVDMLKRICVGESLDFESNALNLIAEQSNGDLRRAINMLQTMALKGSIKEGDVEKSISTDKLLDYITKKQFIPAKVRVEELMNDGISPRELVLSMKDSILLNNKIKNKDKAEFLLLLSDVDYKLVMGATPLLQMLRMILEGMKIC